MKIDEIETNSEQIREILEKPSASILRWGISILFLVVCMVFFVAWVIKYPTVVPAQITITSKIPPHKIIAQSSGKITALFVKENDLVNINQPIGIIENTARFKDVIRLTKEVEKRKVLFKNDSITNIQFQEDLKLGSIQVPYSNFKRAYEEFQEYQIILKENQEFQILHNQIKINKEILKSQSKRLKIYSKELFLSEKDYKRDEKLFKQGVISTKELESKKRTLFADKRNYERLKNNSSNVKIVISNLKKQINTITMSGIESKSKLTRSVTETYEELKNSILTWKQHYLLVSPLEGKVSFFNFWAINQHVTLGDEVLSIVPNSNNQVIARMIMPIQNSGQVSQGQKVIIRLSAYPSQEHGMLLGRVKNISLLPLQNKFIVEVSLPFPLETTFHEKLVLKSELSGTAEIVTEDLRLLERVFYQIRKVFQ